MVSDMNRHKNRALYDNLIKNDHVVFQFFRSAVSSLCSAVTDIGSRVFFFSVVLFSLPDFYRSNISVAIGAIIGGVVNCAINYKFTFHAHGQNKIMVGIKFFICWLGNLLLNMYGTTFAMMPLIHWSFIKTYGLSDDTVFAIVTLVVAIIVSILWNFPVQRYFVFRVNFLDRWALRHYNNQASNQN